MAAFDRNTVVADWGTTNFRAYRFAPDGQLAETREGPLGILSISPGGFPAALEQTIGDWIGPGVEVLLSGMVTSRSGWVETSYVMAPASLEMLAAATIERAGPSGARLRFLPGVAVESPHPDVMRGEEIQVFGVVGDAPEETIVLPGTHAKWVRVRNGRIVAFRTFLTGELYALLLSHSTVGKVASGTSIDADAAFLRGVALINGADSVALLNDVFALRAGVLLQKWPAEDVTAMLSGCLIGSEINAARTLGWTDAPLKIVGSPALSAQYQRAMAAAGIDAAVETRVATVEGFRRLVALERVA